MVTNLGNALTGNAYGDRHYPLPPLDTARVRPAHKPWCADCKRKDRELDDACLCEQCARAAVTRAAQRARWAEAERLEALQAKDQEHADRVIAKAAKPKPTPTKKPKKGEGRGTRLVPLPMDEIAASYAAGTRIADLAAQHGVCVATLGNRLKAHGVQLRGRGPRRTPELEEKVRAAYVDDRLPLEAAAEKAGCGERQASKILHDLGIPIRGIVSKVPREQHPTVVARYLAGETSAEIGATYGVGGGSILYVLRKHNVTIRPRGRASVAS